MGFTRFPGRASRSDRTAAATAPRPRRASALWLAAQPMSTGAREGSGRQNAGTGAPRTSRNARSSGQSGSSKRSAVLTTFPMASAEMASVFQRGNGGLLRDGLDAGALQRCGVEPFDERRGHPPLLVAGAQPPAQRAERVGDGSLAERRDGPELLVHALPKRVAFAQPGEVIRAAHFAGRPAEQAQQRGRPAVHELRPGLDRHRPSREAQRMDAASRAIARLQHRDAAPGTPKLARRGQPRDARADDDDVHADMMRPPRFAGILARTMRKLAALAVAAACARGQAAAPQRRIALSPCRLKGTVLGAQCGALRVAEDRQKPQGRQIDVRVAVVPALARAPAPDALFLLAGGPGQAATEVMGPMLGALERVHRTRDIVLVDQRGTGSSHALRCDLAPPDATLAQRLSSETLSEEKFRRCLAAYDADPRMYTTSIAMQDLDEVREALGYDQIDLWGASYGTRAALVYLREHGERVRAAVLDGGAPLSLRLPLYFARDAQRSMDLLFKHCRE